MTKIILSTYLFLLAILFGIFISPLYAITDTDGDLMPDEYEVEYGFNPSDPADGDQDADQDLILNVEECLLKTDPLTQNTTLSDRELIRLLQIKTFRFYWCEAREPYFFIPDLVEYNGVSVSLDFNSIAGIGFQIAAYVVADQHNWVDHKLAYERIRTMLTRLVELQNPSFDNYGEALPNEQKGNRHGLLYHFVTDQGTKSYNSEISTIDHALLLAGALLAGEYYKGTEVESLAQQLFTNTQWMWLYNGTYLQMEWQEDPNGDFEGGRVYAEWNRYCELTVLLVMAMGVYSEDPTKGIPPTAWDNLKGFPNEIRTLFPGDLGFVDNVVPYRSDINNSGSLTYIHAGSLHNHQYSHIYLDLRDRPDKFGNNYFNNSIAATLVNRQFCMDLNVSNYGANAPPTYEERPYDTYGENQWGLVAGYTSDPIASYKVNQPILPPDSLDFENVAANNDSGSVFPYAPLGSLPFAPVEVKSLLRHLFESWQEQIPYSGYEELIGRYGFMGAFNFGRPLAEQQGHFFKSVLSIDQGPVVSMNENYFTGLIWKFFMRNDVIRNGLEAAGFSIYPVEPYIMNFDDNPPLPADDIIGGQDPNSFGGYSGGWGPTDPATIEYVYIGDPRPDIPYGPQDWARKMTANEVWDGAWIGLNNHNISNWDRLSFWVRGETGAEEFEVGLKDQHWSEYKVPISDYIQITTEWQEVRIPLEVFIENGVRLTNMDNISFAFTSTGGGIIYIDDIAFLGDEFKPSPPKNIKVSVMDRTITLSWDWNTETDVVGYNIYRADEPEGLYNKINDFVVVDNKYTDSAVTQDKVYYYRLTSVDNANPPNESDYSDDIFYVLDTTPPHLEWVRAVNPYILRLRFSEPLPETSLDSATYQITPNVSIITEELSSSQKAIILTTSEHSRAEGNQNIIYSIKVNGVKDIAGNLMQETSATYEISPTLEIIDLNPSDYEVAYLKEGDSPYVYNSDYQIRKIPKALEGFLWIKPNLLEDKDRENLEISFSVNQDIALFIAYDSKIEPPSWLSKEGFIRLNGRVVIEPIQDKRKRRIFLDLYKKRINYKEGRKIELYENLSPEGKPQVMYLIFIKPRGERFKVEEE